MKIFDSKRHLPPGWDWENLKSGLLFGHLFSCLTMLSFLPRYLEARDALFAYTQSPSGSLIRELVPTRTISPFRAILQGWPLTGMWIFLIFMVFQILRYYSSFTSGAMSIYTMRRLPDKWELHRRCWMQPLLSALAEALLFLTLAGLCWLVWYFATPAPCRPF